jgi:hypothetical protein
MASNTSHPHRNRAAAPVGMATPPGRVARSAMDARLAADAAGPGEPETPRDRRRHLRLVLPDTRAEPNSPAIPVATPVVQRVGAAAATAQVSIAAGEVRIAAARGSKAP